MMVKRKVFSMLVIAIFVGSIFGNAYLFGPLVMRGKAAIGPGNEPNHWDNSTSLNVTVFELNPRINWYDFQYNDSGTWVSKRNAQIRKG